MKLSEMNSNQKMAFEIAAEATDYYIGGWENTMLDYDHDSEDYKVAEEMLSLPHGGLVENILSDCRMDIRWQRIENLHLVGLDFLRERISRRLTKYGY